VIELAKRDDVARIAANYPLVKFETPQFTAAPAPAQALGGLDPANWNIDLVDAERAWYELGINGAGVVVADFDTGVDWTHPA
jgi:bacillopeptidase F